MRMAFGLVGILVTLGVIVMIMNQYSLPVARQAIDARNKAEEQFGGNTRQGLQDAQDSIVLDDVEKNGRFDSLLVRSAVAGGPMAGHFGLQAGDSIVAIGPLRTRDITGDEARAYLFDAKTRAQSVTVVRNGEQLDLPVPKAAGGYGAPLQGPTGPLKGTIKIPTH
jgi:hypothetical protein